MTVSDSFVRQGYLGVEQERCQCPWLTRDRTGPASTAREPPEAVGDAAVRQASPNAIDLIVLCFERLM
jgi:hypothetical protein